MAVVGAAQSGFLQSLADHMLRWAYLADADVSHKFHIIDYVVVKVHVGDSAGAFLLRVNHPVNTDTFQGFSVQLVGCPADDEGNAHALNDHRNKDTGFDVLVSQGQQSYVVVGHPHFPQGRFVSSIGPDGVSNVAEHTLNLLFVGVDNQYVMAGLVQFSGNSDSEPPQADNADIFLHPLPSVNLF